MSAPSSPLVSVIIPTYNRAVYLHDAVVSVLNQSLTNIEIIVVDNCSTDATAQMIAGVSDKRIRYFQNEENIGAVANYNRCLELCAGKYIYFFSDDDLMTSIENLSAKAAILEKFDSVSIVHGNITMINHLGEKVGGNWAESNPYWSYIVGNPMLDGHKAFEILYYKMNFINMPTVLVRAELIKQYKLRFNNQLVYLIDWGLWLQMTLLGNAYYIHDPMVAYRLHEKNESKLMAYETYYAELLTIKTSLITSMGDGFPKVKKDIFAIDKSIREQLKAFQQPSRLQQMVKKMLTYSK